MNNVDYKKIMIINQPAGLGDIFYLQKAIKTFVDMDKEMVVYWPIQKEFEYISEYLKHPNINYFSRDKDYPYKNLCEGNYNLFSKKYKFSLIDDENKVKIFYTPFTHAHEEYELLNRKNKYSAMLIKYPFVDMLDENWQNYFTFERNHDREEKLREKYKIKKGEEFIFVNSLFASPPEMLVRPVTIKTNIKIVYNDGAPCHIFDYCWILENAKELHLIESSFCYIVEVLDTTDKLFMYSRIVNGRQQHKNFDYINGIYKKNWIKIYD